MGYAIEKGIPVAPSGAGRPPKYPWREMEVGDSFFLAANGVPTRTIQRRVCNKFLRHGPKMFVSRVVAGGVRVWRTA